MWGLAFVALFLTLAPAIAAYARLSFVKLLADRTPLAELPAWIFTYGKLGLIEACGRAATNAATIAQACAALPDASPVLRLQDVSLSPDMIVLALPDIAELNHSTLGLIAAVALAAALATANGPLSAIIHALGFDTDVTAPTYRRAARGSPPMQSPRSLLVPPRSPLCAAREYPRSCRLWLRPRRRRAISSTVRGALVEARQRVRGALPRCMAGLAVALIYLVGTR